jgi:menaquinol-cytochrome c reductase cytochrome b subunit
MSVHRAPSRPDPVLPKRPPGARGTARPSRDDGRALKEAGIGVVGWLDERTGASPIIRYQLWRKVPRGSDWWGATLGVATLFAFLSQAATGVFLAMFYRPSATEAYESVRHITNDVFLGEFVRGMHKWGAAVMVICLFLHMGANFVIGAYKYPREINWVIGVVLLVLTLTMAFTGILLPFDQRAYWATTIGININASGPVVGPYLADFLRGGAEFGAATLSRFYSLHMLLLPALVIALVAAHLYLVVRLGTTVPPWVRADSPPPLAKRRPSALA